MRPVRRSSEKWRPSIAMVVVVVCAALISVPLVALLAVRLTSNQFVRETEQSLIGQGAIYAELYATAFAALDGPWIGTPLSTAQRQHWNANLHPARAQLNVHVDIVLEPRPEGQDMTASLDTRYTNIADQLRGVAQRARKTTLAGVVFLDHQGRDLNTSGAPSFASLPEVQTALGGDVGAALRARGDNYDPHPLASLSRDTGFRVFVTFPVISRDRVIGVVYLSRTPLNLGKFLFQERRALFAMLAATVFGATLIGFLLLRLISRPIYALRNESRAIAEGRKPKMTPLAHYGLRELAELGDSVSTMADSLARRSQDISTYADHVTHELKSPVTAVIGAAELLRDDVLDTANRTKLLQNIESEGRRMSKLLARLREMTQVSVKPEGGSGVLARMLPQIDGLNVVFDADPALQLPISEEHGRMILLHMAQNSHAHGARDFQITYADRVLRVSDDGEGIADGDRSRVAKPFFTTRRDQGGTGMGLAIVEAVLDRYGAVIECVPCELGAVFEIRFSG